MKNCCHIFPKTKMLFLRKYEYVKKPRTLVGYAPPKEATDPPGPLWKRPRILLDLYERGHGSSWTSMEEATDPPGPLWDDLRDFLRYSRARYHKEQINPKLSFLCSIIFVGLRT